MTATETVLNPAEVAKMFRVKPETVIRWVRAGLLPGTNVALPEATRERWRFTQANIDEFQRRRASKPAPVASPRRAKSRDAIREYV